MSLKLKGFKTATVYDRIYLNYPGRNLVIEYVDGYCQFNECDLGEWRLINLDTGIVEEKSTIPHAASIIQRRRFSDSLGEGPAYIPEKPEKRTWKQLPLNDKLRHVVSHAQDLEHDFKLEGDTRCPINVVLQDFDQRYNNEPSFYKKRNGEWELYE
jgi:hypothetical protein